MRYQRTTQVPNELVDVHLTDLTFSELKILIYIIRQTYGWKLKNGKRKQRDRITYKLFNTKTGVSIRAIPGAIQSLIIKHLITVTDYQGNKLHKPEQRKGKVGIFYAPCLNTYAEKDKKVCTYQQRGVQNRPYNKTNTTKLNRQKRFRQRGRISDWERMQEIIESRKQKRL